MTKQTLESRVEYVINITPDRDTRVLFLVNVFTDVRMVKYALKMMIV